MTLRFTTRLHPQKRADIKRIMKYVHKEFKTEIERNNNKAMKKKKQATMTKIIKTEAEDACVQHVNNTQDS